MCLACGVTCLLLQTLAALPDKVTEESLPDLEDLEGLDEDSLAKVTACGLCKGGVGPPKLQTFQ